MSARHLLALGVAVVIGTSACSREDERHHVGDTLGDYVLEGSGGVRLRTLDLRTRVLLIHFFEADSGECRAQAERIRSLWFPRRGAGMNVVGVCPETDAGEIARVVHEWARPYPVFPDPERAFARGFAPRSYPWNVVVGRDGRILLSEKGSWDRVHSAVTEALRANVPGPDHVRVQHLLVGFGMSVPRKSIDRSKAEAAELAAELFERAKAGEDFGELVKEYSADAWPGVYRVANFNVPIDADAGEAERGTLVQSFGDVAFSLEVGGIGMAQYDPLMSRFGWHIIRRLD